MGTGGKIGAAKPSAPATGNATPSAEKMPFFDRMLSSSASAAHATTAATRAEMMIDVRGEVKATTAVAGTSAANSTVAVQITRRRGRSSTSSRYRREKQVNTAIAASRSGTTTLIEKTLAEPNQI